MLGRKLYPPNASLKARTMGRMCISFNLSWMQGVKFLWGRRWFKRAGGWNTPKKNAPNNSKIVLDIVHQDQNNAPPYFPWVNKCTHNLQESSPQTSKAMTWNEEGVITCVHGHLLWSKLLLCTYWLRSWLCTRVVSKHYIPLSPSSWMLKHPTSILP